MYRRNSHRRRPSSSAEENSGARSERSQSAVDSNGNAYVTGSTQSSNFPLASQNAPGPSGTNIFVAKLDVSGSSLVYADYIGGNSEDYPSALALDGANHVFLTGYTYSGDFPVVNAFQSSTTGGPDAFVMEVAADGASLLYSTYLGGGNYDSATGLALDGSGNIFVGGFTSSLDFPTANALQATAFQNENGHYGEYGFLTGQRLVHDPHRVFANAGWNWRQHAPSVTTPRGILISSRSPARDWRRRHNSAPPA